MFAGLHNHSSLLTLPKPIRADVFKNNYDFAASYNSSNSRYEKGIIFIPNAVPISIVGQWSIVWLTAVSSCSCRRAQSSSSISQKLVASSLNFQWAKCVIFFAYKLALLNKISTCLMITVSPNMHLKLFVRLRWEWVHEADQYLSLNYRW